MVKSKSIDNNEYNDILNSLVGVLPDEGKSVEDYRRERIEERYRIPFKAKGYTAETNLHVTMMEDKDKK